MPARWNLALACLAVSALLGLSFAPGEAGAGSVAESVEKSISRKLWPGRVVANAAPKLTAAAAGSFAGKPIQRRLAADTRLYRYHDAANAAPRRGDWVYLTPQGDLRASQAVEALALPGGHQGKYVTVYDLPKGTWVAEGNVAPAWGRQGGGYQVVVEDVSEKWIVAKALPVAE